MSAAEVSWQRANGEYLSKAVQWIRLLLQSQAEQYITDPKPQVQRAHWFTRNNTQPHLPPPQQADTLMQLEQALNQAETGAPAPAVSVLVKHLELSPFEKNLILLCAAIELDPCVAELCARAQNDAQRPYPTFALAFELFHDDAAWSALHANSALRYWKLIEIHQPGARPLTASALVLDERILNFIKGYNALDDRLAAYIMAMNRWTVTLEDLPPSQQSIVQAILSQAPFIDGVPGQAIQLVGADDFSKRDIACALANKLEWNVFRMPLGLIPTQSTDLESLARLWQRESRLLPMALYLEITDADAAAIKNAQFFITRYRGWVLIDTRELRSEFGAASLAFDVNKPTANEQQIAWQAEVPDMSDGDAAHLATQFNLNLAAIESIALRASALSPQMGTRDQESNALAAIWQSCLLHTRPRLDRLAQRIEPKAGWDDLILPDETRCLLKQIAEQVPNRHKVYDDWGFRQKTSRGLGISALFAGASGTGKTLAAEVIAKELNLNLYRIDLSAVISKYIGETEKNLRQVFDTAEDGGTLLFFDEADALFGKRSEVKDSHDRFANTQVADLLQRMESYSGLAVLATNMKGALDPAFLRRLRFIVNFTFPGVVERKSIWQRAFTQKMFAPDTDGGDLDFERLAQFNLTGGNINSIALNAAFMAAQEDRYVTMHHVLQAVRTELRKLDKPVNEAEFRKMEVVRSRS